MCDFLRGNHKTLHEPRFFPGLLLAVCAWTGRKTRAPGPGTNLAYYLVSHMFKWGEYMEGEYFTTCENSVKFKIQEGWIGIPAALPSRAAHWPSALPCTAGLSVCVRDPILKTTRAAKPDEVTIGVFAEKGCQRHSRFHPESKQGCGVVGSGSRTGVWTPAQSRF